MQVDVHSHMQTIWSEIFVIHEFDVEPDQEPTFREFQRLRCEDKELQFSGSSVIGIWNDSRKSSSWVVTSTTRWVQVVLYNTEMVEII